MQCIALEPQQTVPPNPPARNLQTQKQEEEKNSCNLAQVRWTGVKQVAIFGLITRDKRNYSSTHTLRNTTEPATQEWTKMAFVGKTKDKFMSKTFIENKVGVFVAVNST